jgi:hypothetical protein
LHEAYQPWNRADTGKGDTLGNAACWFLWQILAIALVIAQHIAALLRKRDSPISNFPTRWAAVRMIPDFKVLIPLWPVFMSYVLSFIYVDIYWNKPQYASYPRIRRRG